MTAKSPKITRVALLDDHAVVREGYAAALQRDESIIVAGLFESSAALSAALRAGLALDVLVMDYALGARDVDGINLIAALRSRYPDLALLVASAHDNAATVSLVLQAGALGFISKREPVSSLLMAVRAVAMGQRYLSDISTARMAGLAEASDASHADTPADDNDDRALALLMARLSRREQEVMRCFLDGMLVGEVAAKFSRSVKTISNQKQTAFKKLGIRSIAELASLRDGSGAW
ncbi:response regulator transcription factor [Alcaligenaceae bacterium A4P071]|nr:response regulator transcription factor [Alcaligenaceae bacterium B3P038]MDQ2184349.1 response regulator transcription factor [Alcaligenaceae bacterium A4P071]